MLQPICGGTLISNKHILTAAHCCYGTGLRLAHIGGLNLYDDNDGTDPYNVLITSIKIHPEYDSDTQENDIAILKTLFSVPSRFVPACLPLGDMKNKILEGKEAIIAGWGRTSYEGEQSSVLLQAEVVICSEKECKTNYSRVEGMENSVIDYRVVCAGKLGKDSCQGDSGGPLMIQYNNRIIVVGVVSWGLGCAVPSFPGIYTKVATFLDSFILPIMGIERSFY
ncbi:Venom protease [Trachymyrmex zeteki]|uniref:Venom protease n=1 Tax=Mycetomoellerius zeteki TaxID=64791 RepID=A0A151WS22_9HYME|nr:Venom protease [Trachymyrmex zeteki]